MERQDKWFKILLRPGERAKIERLAKGRGRDMSSYVRWLLDRDEKEQAETGPQQTAMFG